MREEVSLLAAVPQFSVADVVRTAEYYRDVLGFEIAGYWDGEHVDLSPKTAPLFAIVRRDAIEIFFNRAGHGDMRTGRAEGAYDVYFHVRGVDTLAEEIRSRGGDIVEGPDDRVYGQRELVIRDCNGFVLAFAESAAR